MTATSFPESFARASIFVDSDILIRAHAAGPWATRERAAERLRRLWMTRDGRLSVQVLQECYLALCRHDGSGEDLAGQAVASEILRNYESWVVAPETPATIRRATEIQALAGLPFWNAMIVAAAEQARSGLIWSERLPDRQLIAGIRILNPLL